MSKPWKLVFFGNERLVSGLTRTEAPLLRGLVERGYNVVAVVVNHTDGTSRSARKLEVAAVAEAHNIPVLSPVRPTDIVDTLRAFDADAAVLSAYGRLLPQRIIDVFNPVGIINLHPSLLPRHRGPTPLESTLLSGDTTAGVSIMQLTAGMDEGPLYGQVAFDIPTNIDKFALCEKASQAGAALLFELLPDILLGRLQPKPQAKNDVSFTTLITKPAGQLDTLTDDALTLERKIRAYQGFPKPHLFLYNNDVIITSSRVVKNATDGSLVIPCARNTWLEVTTLIAPSGREMSGEAFLRGYVR